MKAIFSESFMRGFARVLNLDATKEWPIISDGMQADYEALRDDWENVGENIRRAQENCKRA